MSASRFAARRALSAGVAGFVALVALAACAPRAGAEAPMSMPMPAATLTRADLERDVLAHNPSLEAIQQSLAAARARVDVSGAWSDPELSFMFAPASLNSGPPASGWRVALRQRIPLNGERGARRDGALAESEAIGGDYEAARLDLLREARVAFADYRRATRSEVAHRAMVDLASEFRQVALVKYAAGTAEQQDPLTAGVEAARLTHHQVELESARRVAVARINALLGRSAALDLPPPADDPGELAMDAVALPDTDSLLILARKSRPELRAATSRLAVGVAQRRVIERSRWPDLMVGVSYDRYMREQELRPSIEIGIGVPILNGRSDAELESEHRIAAAEAEYRALALRIQRDVVEAAARYDEAAHDVAVLRDGVLPATEQALAASRSSYEANRGGMLQMLDVARTLSESRLDLIDAVARRAIALADLERAVGSDAPVVPMEDMR